MADATQRQIAADLGPEWLTEPKNSGLRQMLGRMVRGHILLRSRRGVYTVAPSYQWLGLDVQDQMENDIARFLHRCGGRARTRDIHDAVGNGPERGYLRRLVTQTLKRSPRFRQDFGRGVWNLSGQERERPSLGESVTISNTFT